MLNKFIQNKMLMLSIMAIGILTLLTGYSYYWNTNNVHTENLYHALEEAKTHWNKDAAFRKWATLHGGLYVKSDKRTPPNPALAHLPNRDVVTTEGMELTLMNPAYMMRQMTGEFEQTYGIKGKITGKKQLNPINKPDEWEQQVLSIFESRRVSEIYEQQVINNQPYLRYMKPMYMTEGCVKCHAILGYKDGDLGGGVSISVPLTPYISAASDTNKSILTTHIVVWLAGLVLIILLILLIISYDRKRTLTVVKLQESERRKEEIIWGTNIGTWEWNVRTGETIFNERWAEIIGYTLDELKPVNIETWTAFAHPDDMKKSNELLEKIFSRKLDYYEYETRMRHKNGDWIWVLDRGKVTEWTDDGKPLRMSGTHTDITERKQAETELISLKQQMEFILGATKTGVDIIDGDFNLRYVDPEWQKVYGNPEGRKCYEYFADLEEKCDGCGIPEALESKKTIVTEEVLPKEGNRPIQVTSMPFQDLNGEWLIAEVNVDITQRKQMENKLKHMATHDPLTGIYNRNEMELRLTDEIERASRYNHNLSIFMLDIDHFKAINDTYGHKIGDDVLCSIAKNMESSIRNTDYVARYGGEEFVVILPETDISKAKELAQRMLKKIAEHRVPISNDQEINVTISIGIATFSDHAKTGLELLKVADSCMYAAKQAGRNQVKSP